MAGVRRGREKGSSSAKRDRGGEWLGENWGGGRLPSGYCLFRFLRPDSGRKNRDWSDGQKGKIDCSDWSEGTHGLFAIYIQHGARL